MLETFTIETFSPHQGDTFRLRREDGDVDLRLAEVTALGEGSAAAGAASRRPFSLIFHGPSGFVLPQRIYALAHGDVGEFELFLVPLGPEGEAMRYQAIFT